MLGKGNILEFPSKVTSSKVTKSKIFYCPLSNRDVCFKHMHNTSNENTIAIYSAI